MYEISFDWTFRNRCGGGGGGGHTGAEVATTPNVSHARTATPEQLVASNPETKKNSKKGHLLLHGYRRFPKTSRQLQHKIKNDTELQCKTQTGLKESPTFFCFLPPS
jgi:hypothetical protein